CCTGPGKVKTPDSDSAPAAYVVAVDASGSRRESLGPLFVRMSVRLSGRIDATWCRAYEAITSETERFSRFTLDPVSGVVAFTCRASEGSEAVQSLIERLNLLLELTNLRATLEATREKLKSA